MLRCARVATAMARCPKLNDDKDSEASASQGLILMTNAVLALPPKLSCSNLVNLESRNGICLFFSDNAEIQLPNADNDKLIDFNSLKRTPCVAPLFRTRSI